MTISYSSKVFTSSGKEAIFLRLLRRWKGSIYKLVWHDLVIYVSLYYMLSGLYRFVLNDELKSLFELVALYCNNYANLIPVTFVLGFYVNLVIQRWWEQFMALPWPDSPALWVSTAIHGHDERGRLMRRTIVRYINLSNIMVLRLTCLPVKKRFPTLHHLVEAGILMEGEKKIIEKLDEATMNHPKYWMPLVWAGSIVSRARKEGRVKDDYAMKELIQQIDNCRLCNGTLMIYDWVSLPLVYTQVVTLAVYSFLLSTLMGRQFLDAEKKIPGYEVDLIVPVFTFLQFFFYMGWLKVAEAQINPFGEDDDDFDANFIIDRNLLVSYLIVDEMHTEHPDLVRDQFWDDIFPELPYTAAAEETRTEPIIGAAAQVEIAEEDAEFLPINDAFEACDQDPLLEDDGGNDHGSKKSILSVGKSEQVAINILSPSFGKKKRNQNTCKITRKSSKASSVNENMVVGDSRVMLELEQGQLHLPKNHSEASKLGSSGNVSQSGSLMYSMFRKVLGRSSANLNDSMGAATVLGSSHSLLSKTSRHRRRRLRGHHHHRSQSRVSNSSQRQSPVHLVRGELMREGHRQTRDSAPDNETMFKMSSTSSLNSFHPPSMSEFSSMHTSKCDVHDMLKNDLSAFQRQQQSKRRIMSASCGSVDDLTRQENKMLKQKLEAIQTLQNDILAILNKESEENEHFDADAVTSDLSNIVNAVEERTVMLQKQLMKRETTGQTSTGIQYSPAHTAEQNITTDVALCSRKNSINFTETPSTQPCPQTVIPCSPTVQTQQLGLVNYVDQATDAMANQEAPDPLITVSVDPSTPSEVAPDSRQSEMTKQVSSVTDLEDQVVADVETPSPMMDEEGSYETELSTIEEQPELGYQSDSSETDMLLPKDKTTVAYRNHSLTTVAEDEEVAAAGAGAAAGECAA